MVLGLYLFRIDYNDKIIKNISISDKEVGYENFSYWI